jgi:hypothetical protein
VAVGVAVAGDLSLIGNDEGTMILWAWK